MRRQLRSNGQKIAEVSIQQLGIAGGLGAIRDVLLDGSQSTICKFTDKRIAHNANLARNAFLATFLAMPSRPRAGGDCIVRRLLVLQRVAVLL